MNVVELFSGIGSQYRALENVSQKYSFPLRVINTCEWDIHAIIAYDVIHNGIGILPEVETMDESSVRERLHGLKMSTDGKTPLSYRSIKGMNPTLAKTLLSAILRTKNLVDIRGVHGEDFSGNIDLMTYSFPCQDLSNVGALHGYVHGIDRQANTRSGLLWEVGRILQEREDRKQSLPKYLVLENVLALNSSRHRKNFEEWQGILKRFGYTNHFYEMYAPDFGIPQNRNRLIMLSVFNFHDQTRDEELDKIMNEWDFSKNVYFGKKKSDLSRFLKTDYSRAALLAEALECQPNDTASRKKIWEENLKIIDENQRKSEMVATLTTKQDRHPNSGNLFFAPQNGRSSYRFLTPRECFSLMGFRENDYLRLAQCGLQGNGNRPFFSRDKMYRLTGNSIVINVLEPIFEMVAIIDKLYPSKE